MAIKPELIIEIGSKKGKGKSYPTISIHAKDNHRSSMGSNSTNDSLGSEASYTVRTGYPDTSLPPLKPSRFGTGDFSLGHQRSVSSEESYIGPSRVPSLYRTSEGYDTSSLATTASSTTRPIVHNSQRHVPSPINTTLGQSGSPLGSYRTTVVTPNGIYDETPYRAGRNNRQSFSRAETEAVEITRRSEDRERQRLEARRKQEGSDREVAAALIREENRKAPLESSRAKDREEQRAEKSFASRADGRERLRQQQRMEREGQSTRDSTSSKRPQPQASSSRPLAPSRRGSTRMTPSEAAKQQQLFDADIRQMHEERIKAEAIERDERMQQQQLTLLQRQQNPEYYNPRSGGNTALNGQGPMFRCDSFSSSVKQHSLAIPGSKRDSSTNQPRQDRHQPPVSYHNSNNDNIGSREKTPQSRARRLSSSHQERLLNPFAQPAPVARTDDPWDIRNGRSATLDSSGPQVDHSFPQQASHHLFHATHGGEYESDSDEDYHSRKR